MGRLIALLCYAVISLPILAETGPAERLQAIHDEIKRLSRNAVIDQQQRQKLTTQLAQQQAIMQQSDKAIQQTNDNIRQLQQQSAQLTQQQQTLTAQQRDELLDLASQIRHAYAYNRPHSLQIFLSQSDPSQLNRIHRYYHYFHQARLQHLETITSSLQTIADQQTRHQQQQQRQKDLLTQQQEQRKHLLAQQHEQLNQANALQEQFLHRQQRLDYLEQQAVKLQQLIDSLSQHDNDSHETLPFSQLKGQLPWPYIGKLIQRFGDLRQVGKLRWQGLVIAAPLKQTIHAVADGHIVFSEWLPGFGLLLIIEHSDKYMTLYGNNHSLLKSAGESVSRGEAVALSGQQGIKASPGLYFELRHKGKPLDPIQWLVQHD